MKPAIVVLLLVVNLVPSHSVLSHTFVSTGRGRDAHPVENVIGLLKELREQVVLEGQQEEVAYSKFAKWCDDSKRTLQKAVAASKTSIESLQNEVDSKIAENSTLTEQIATLADEIAKYEAANGENEGARTTANQKWSEADGDFESTIQAFGSAITALKAAKPSSEAVLVQEFVGKISPAALLHLSATQVSLLMEAGGNSSDSNTTERPDLLASGDYGTHTKQYSFKSDSVIELLKELKASFEDQRVEATKAETNAANSYELAKDARDRALQAARAAQSERTTELTDCQSALATASGKLSDAQGDLSADTTTLGDTTTTCNMKNTEWEERASIRSKEIKAIDAGVKILAKVTGVRTGAPENPVMPAAPVDAPTDFVQEGFAAAFPQSDPRARAVTLLKSEATRLHSKAFQRFATELEARVAGPFDEVNNMIQKMIFRLMAEQKNEDDHKNWCDLELEKTSASKLNKEDKIVELGLKITEAQTSVGELTQQIVDANTMVASIDGFVEEATEIRNTGKKENALAVTDAKKAQAAIAKAIAVLKDFYKSTGMVAKEAWEFVQRDSAPVTLPADPSTWDASYVGASDPLDPGSGVVAVLESIATDFSTMQASTMAQEATDEKNYQEEMKTQEISKARRSKEAEMKAEEKKRLLEKIASLQKTEKHTKEEKTATEQYLKDLEPACIDGDSTYDDRKAARDEEVQALKEAQVVLADAFKDNSTEAANSTDFLQGDAFPIGRSFLAPVRPLQ